MNKKARPEAVVCAALFVSAALVRVLFLAGTVDRSFPFSVFYYGDSRIYREFALALIQGNPFDEGVPLHPPGFAYVLSWVIGLVGERPAAVRLVLAVVSASVVPMTYLLGRTIWSRTVGLTAAMLVMFSFGSCVLSVSANAETIYVPLLVAQALLLVAFGDALASNPRPAATMLGTASGVVLGLGSLTRAEYLGLVVLVPAALAIGWPSIERGVIARWAVAIAGIAALVILPWTIHNHFALARFNAAHAGLAAPLPTWVGVSGAGPLVFALSNNARADGTFQPDAVLATMGGGRIDLADPAQAELYVRGFRRGFAFLAGEPGAAATLLMRKIALASDAHALGFGLSNWPGGLVGTRRAVDVFTPDRKIWKPVSLILLAFGVWVSRPVLRRSGILWLAALFGVAVTLATFGYTRFFLQAAPFVFLFQAAAIEASRSRLRSPTARRAVALLGAVLAGALAIELAVGAARPRNFRASGSTNPVTGKILQDAAVDLAPAPVD